MRAVRWAEGVKPLLVPIDQVRQHPDNPNNGDDENLVESIQTNGFVTVITADANTGYIIAGNTRYRALLALGATEIPVAWVDHWDETGAVRYLIGDNASARKAVMDVDAQLGLLKLLELSEIGLQGTSISDAEYQKMLMEQANTPLLPEGTGFGQQGALNQFQVVLDFDEDEDERDRVFAILVEQYERVRTVNL